MKNLKNVFYLLLFLCVILAATKLFAGGKTIYIKPFGIEQGLPENDPARNLIKDYISEIIIEKGGYSIISDDEVQQVISSEEMKMSLDICYDDACIRQLMQSIKTDYIIYGSLSFIENKYFITAKILDRTSGSVVLARVKTINFTKRDWMERGSKALGEFMITGKDNALKEFGVYLSIHEKENYESVPSKLVGWESNVVNRAPRIRLGMGRSFMDDSEMSDMYKGTWINFLADLYLLRERDTNGNGFDFFTRVNFKVFSFNKEKLSDYNRVSGSSINESTFKSGELGYIGINAGPRYITGFYYSGIQWQGYISLAYQYLRLHEMMDNGGDIMGQEIDKRYSSLYGIIGGVGIEIGFSPYFGIFAECDYGYNPVKMWGKTRNIDGFNIYYGVTLRTSYVD